MKIGDIIKTKMVYDAKREYIIFGIVIELLEESRFRYFVIWDEEELDPFGKLVYESLNDLFYYKVDVEVL